MSGLPLWATIGRDDLAQYFNPPKDRQQERGPSYSATRKNRNPVGRAYEEREKSIDVLPISFDEG